MRKLAHFPSTIDKTRAFGTLTKMSSRRCRFEFMRDFCQRHKMREFCQWVFARVFSKYQMREFCQWSTEYARVLSISQTITSNHFDVKTLIFVYKFLRPLVKISKNYQPYDSCDHDRWMNSTEAVPNLTRIYCSACVCRD